MIVIDSVTVTPKTIGIHLRLAHETEIAAYHSTAKAKTTATATTTEQHRRRNNGHVVLEGCSRSGGTAVTSYGTSCGGCHCGCINRGCFQQFPDIPFGGREPPLLWRWRWLSHYCYLHCQLLSTGTSFVSRILLSPTAQSMRGGVDNDVPRVESFVLRYSSTDAATARRSVEAFGAADTASSQNHPPSQQQHYRREQFLFDWLVRRWTSVGRRLIWFGLQGTEESRWSVRRRQDDAKVVDW